MVEQMASFSDAQARAQVQDPSKLEWSTRRSPSTVTIWGEGGRSPTNSDRRFRLDSRSSPLPRPKLEAVFLSI